MPHLQILVLYHTDTQIKVFSLALDLSIHNKKISYCDVITVDNKRVVPYFHLLENVNVPFTGKRERDPFTPLETRQ